MVTEPYLQYDKSIKWSKFLQVELPNFNAIWKTLIQLLLVFHFTPSRSDFKLYNSLLIPLKL